VSITVEQPAAVKPADSAPMLDWALYWAAQSIAVFPLNDRIREGAPAPTGQDWSKLPRSMCQTCKKAKDSGTESDECHTQCGHRLCHGFYGATTDPNLIRWMWSNQPRPGGRPGENRINSNIGGRTGKESGLYTPDFDKDKTGQNPDGEAAFDALIGELGIEYPETQMHMTGSGGIHLLFNYPDRAPSTGCDFGNRQDWPAKNIDIRGDGGYIVLPPSRSASGEYVIITEGILVIPDALLKRTEQPKGGVKTAPAAPVITASVRPSADGVHLCAIFARARFAKKLDELRRLVTEGNGRTSKYTGYAKYLSALASQPETDLTEAEIRDELLSAAHATGFVDAKGIGYVERQIDNGIRDGRGTTPHYWPPIENRKDTRATSRLDADAVRAMAEWMSDDELREHADLCGWDWANVQKALGNEPEPETTPVNPPRENQPEPTAPTDTFPEWTDISPGCRYIGTSADQAKRCVSVIAAGNDVRNAFSDNPDRLTTALVNLIKLDKQGCAGVDDTLNGVEWSRIGDGGMLGEDNTVLRGLRDAWIGEKRARVGTDNWNSEAGSTARAEWNTLITTAVETVKAATVASGCQCDNTRPDTGGSTTTWGAPTPLTQTPPPLPIDAFGPVAAPFITALAESLQIPGDLAANLTLPVISTAAAGQWRIVINPDWTETLAIGTVSAAESGERKSATIRAISTPLRDFEEATALEMKTETRTARVRYELEEARVKELKSKAVKAKDYNDREQARMECEEAAERLARMYVPKSPRWVVDDTTPESLLRLLDENDGGLGVFSAEGGFFDQLGRYTDTPQLDGVLKAMAGDSISVDRQTRDPLTITNPALSAGLCTQPGRFAELGSDPRFRVTGLLARFGYVLPAPRVGFRAIDTNPVPDHIRRTWADGIQELATEAHFLRLARLESRTTGKEVPARRDITLDHDASAVLREFRITVEPQLRAAGELGNARDWGSKAPGLAARIAAALTLLSDHKATHVTGDAMTAAVAIVTGYIPHVITAFGNLAGADNETTQASIVLEWIKDHTRTQLAAGNTDIRRGVKVGDIRAALKGQKWVKTHPDGPAAAIKKAVTTLAEHGSARLIRVQPIGGGRPSDAVELNPVHLA
jgi:replicative DNA helicase